MNAEHISAALTVAAFNIPVLALIAALIVGDYRHKRGIPSKAPFTKGE